MRIPKKYKTKTAITVSACIGMVVAAVIVGIVSSAGKPNDLVSAQVLGDAACGASRAIRTGMDESTSPQLRKLAEYEKVCGSSFVAKQMLFTHMPTTAEEAQADAVLMAGTLKEFAKYNVPPLVIFEPTNAAGEILPMQRFREGRYDTAIAMYFESLKAQGVTDKIMGTWVPFPEANTPVWVTTDADDFAANVTKVVKSQKHYFPDSRASILLDSRSHPSNDEQWAHGKYVSLKPYVKDIPKGLIDSFGYQGLPWLPPAGEPQSVGKLKVSEFLQPKLAREAAKSLGVRYVWFNTGTFSEAHTGRSATRVAMGNDTRASLLKEAVRQAKVLEDEGYSVALHIFAEDKSDIKEGVDWSYWQPGNAAASEGTQIFKDFVRNALSANLQVWLYDAERP